MKKSVRHPECTIREGLKVQRRARRDERFFVLAIPLQPKYGRRQHYSAIDYFEPFDIFIPINGRHGLALPVVVTTHPLTGCIPPSFPSAFVPSDYGGWTDWGENMGHGCFYVNTRLLYAKFNAMLLNYDRIRENRIERIEVIRKREIKNI